MDFVLVPSLHLVRLFGVLDRHSVFLQIYLKVERLVEVAVEVKQTVAVVDVEMELAVVFVAAVTAVVAVLIVQLVFLFKELLN